MTKCKLCMRRRRRWQSTKRGRRWGRCSIYRHVHHSRLSQIQNTDGLNIRCKCIVLTTIRSEDSIRKRIGWPIRFEIRFERKKNDSQVPNRWSVFVDCHSRRLGIDRQCTHSLHRNDIMIWPIVILSSVVTAGYALVSCCWLTEPTEALGGVVAVVVLYQTTVFLQQNTTVSLLGLYFND